jgi:hypothetical protein
VDRYAPRKSAMRMAGTLSTRSIPGISAARAGS